MNFWRRYWALIRPFKRDIIWSMGLMAMVTVMGLAAPYINKLVFDLINVWGMPQMGAEVKTVEALRGWMPETNTMWWLAGVILLAKVLVEVASSTVGVLNQRTWLRLYLLMSERMPVLTMSHLLKLSIGHHVQENTSKQITKIDRGVNAASQLTDRVFGRLLPEVLTIPVFSVALLILEWRVGVLSLVLGVITGVWVAYDFRSLKAYRQRMEKLYQRSSTIGYEALGNIATVQAFGREQHERGRISEILAKIRSVEWVQWARVMLGGYLRDGMANISGALVILIGLWGLEANTLTLGTMVMLLQLNDRLIRSCRTVTREWMELGRNQEALMHLMDLLDKQPEVVSLPTAIRMDRLEGDVVFDQVSFSYDGNGTGVKDVSFTAHSGEMVALVGPSGSGKSTLVTLLLRGYDVHSGAIEVDGDDLRVLNLEDWRRQIGIVPQNVELFSISIRDNIAYGRPDASEAEIRAAADLAGAHEFIERKPDGYDTIVGEKGLDLSGGERQRIGIARAILRDPRLLIFDEATSNLDVISEARIQAALEELRQGRTTIVIAHRFSTIQRADHIVVMDEGRVVAQGTRDELRVGSPLFTELERLQSELTIRD